MTSLWIKLSWITLIFLILSSFYPVSLSNSLIPTIVIVGTPRSMVIITCSSRHLIPDLKVNHLGIVLIIPAPLLMLNAVLVD